jgi:peptide/nickel transport system substrate-binding protein
MNPARLAAESMNMAPAKGLADFKEKFVTDRFIGTGPFKFVEHVSGDRVVVEANPGYWGPKPASQRIVWQVIPDAATRVAALQRGDIDVMLNLPIPLTPGVESDPNLRVYSELSSLTHVILLNTKEGVAPLKDRRVRQALNMAIDRQAIIKNLYAGRGRLLNGVAGPLVGNGMDPGAYPYDPAGARKLLAEAGHPNGFELTLKTKIQMLEWAEYNKRSGTTQHKDAFYYAFINATWDVSYMLQRFKPSFTAFRYYDATGAFLKTLEDYDVTFDPKKRRDLAAAGLKGARDEAVWVTLWQLDQLTGVSKKVKGFKIRPDDVIWARDAYVEA